MTFIIINVVLINSDLYIFNYLQQEQTPAAANTSSATGANAESERVNTEMEGEEEMMREEQGNQSGQSSSQATVI
jgi:hypothetical protein